MAEERTDCGGHRVAEAKEENEDEQANADKKEPPRIPEEKPDFARHRGPKAQRENEIDRTRSRKKESLRLETQLRKKKYSRPIDDQCLDDINFLMTTMGVKEKWRPVGTCSVKFSALFGTDEEIEGDMEKLMATRLQCITGMMNYESKSLEELHLDDHITGFRYRGFPTGTFLFKKTKMKNTDLNYKWAQTGTLEIGPWAVEGTDEEREGEMMAEQLTLCQCITAMEEYQTKSLEELRFEDYIAGLNAIKARGFNMPPSKNWYEDMPGLLKEGTAKYEFKPFDSYWQDTYHSDDVSFAGMPNEIYPYTDTRWQSVTAMTVYKNQSFEELRLQDYLAGRRGPQVPKYRVSEEELAKQKIHYDMEVCIFISRGGNEVREKGKVKFIGRLPEKVFGKIHVGIKLQRPVGDCDGRYQGVRLFRTDPNYGKIVPVGAVLPIQLFDEFHTDESDLEDECDESQSIGPGRFTQVPKPCCVCLTNSIDTYLTPCGHVCCCDACSKRITSCPICRRHISQRSRVFLP